jgi:hypothetical protein
MVIRDYVRHHDPRRWLDLKKEYGESYSKFLLYTRMRFGLPLMPIDFWYDKPHIVRRDDYLNFVFGQRHFNFQTGVSMEVTNFVEDSLGNIERSNIKRHGYCGFSQYGTYSLYDDPSMPILGHLDGRSYLTEEQKARFRKSYYRYYH